MDPLVNLLRQRELAQQLVESAQAGAPLVDEAVELAELVLALDEWRRKGGFDPYLM